jgi:hypothetical protein
VVPQCSKPELRYSLNLLVALRFVLLDLCDPCASLFLVVLIVRVRVSAGLNLSFGRLSFAGDKSESPVIQG